MIFLNTVFQNLPSWIWAFPAVIVLYFVGYMIYARKARGKQENYFNQHPEASRIYCDQGMKGIKTLRIWILSLDGNEHLIGFPEGTKYAYMVLPGRHIIEVCAATTRPGVVYRNVTEEYEPQKLDIEVGTAKKYALGFDNKTKAYTFKEITED